MLAFGLVVIFLSTPAQMMLTEDVVEYILTGPVLWECMPWACHPAAWSYSSSVCRDWGVREEHLYQTNANYPWRGLLQ
jgi:hypothetical protein